MAALVTVAISIVLTAVVFGGFIWVSCAIGWEDRRRGSLRLDAPSSRTRVARRLVNVSKSGWQ